MDGPKVIHDIHLSTEFDPNDQVGEVPDLNTQAALIDNVKADVVKIGEMVLHDRHQNQGELETKKRY